MMKKIYIIPKIEVVTFHDLNELCSGLTGWSAYNESNRTLDSGGKTDNDEDPDFGVAGSKQFSAWNTWDE